MVNYGTGAAATLPLEVVPEESESESEEAIARRRRAEEAAEESAETEASDSGELTDILDNNSR